MNIKKLYTLIAIILLSQLLACSNDEFKKEFDPVYKPGKQLPLAEDYSVDGNYININGKLYEMKDYDEKNYFEVEVPRADRYVITIPSDRDYEITQTGDIKAEKFSYAFGKDYPSDKNKIFWHDEFKVSITSNVSEIEIKEVKKDYEEDKSIEKTAIVLKIK